jgi:lipoate-protein ligase A
MVGRHAIRSPGMLSAAPLEDHLAEDRRLLDVAELSWRVGIVDRAGVSAGVSVDAASPALVRAREAGLPVSRRTTGGTIVLASRGDLVWSLVLPVASERAGRPRLHAYARLGKAVTRWLERSGVHADWGEPLGRSDEFCLLGPRGSVLVAGGRALAGAAQHRSAHALLHHGLILRTVDRRRLARLFAMDPSLLRRTTTSLEELGATAPAVVLARRLADSLRTVADEW